MESSALVDLFLIDYKINQSSEYLALCMFCFFLHHASHLLFRRLHPYSNGLMPLNPEEDPYNVEHDYLNVPH